MLWTVWLLCVLVHLLRMALGYEPHAKCRRLRRESAGTTVLACLLGMTGMYRLDVSTHVTYPPVLPTRTARRQD